MSLRIILALLCLAWLGSPLHAATTQPPVILVVGDSLSAGYGLRPGEGWVTLLQARLRREGYGHRVVNASSSGETTGGALSRLPRALDLHRPAIVVLELGGNDGLRGLPVAQVRANFDKLIDLSRKAGARVLLVGILVPPNYGPVYSKSFQDLYASLARQYTLPLVPFFLDGIALDDSLMQEDGFHPNAAAQPRMLELVWPKLKPLLR